MGEFALPNSRSEYSGVGPGWNRQVVHATALAELPTTALQTGDITQLMYVPAGAIVIDAYIKADDMDTGTSLTMNIGDATTTNLFFAATTTGQAGGSAAMASTARYTKFAAATRLKMTVATGARAILVEVERTMARTLVAVGAAASSCTATKSAVLAVEDAAFGVPGEVRVEIGGVLLREDGECGGGVRQHPLLGLAAGWVLAVVAHLPPDERRQAAAARSPSH